MAVAISACDGRVIPAPEPENESLGGIMRAYGEDWMRGKVFTRRQLTALIAIRDCRTPANGTRRDVCDDCGAVRLSHLSCGDRHCPQCQFTNRTEWLLAREAELLPVPYFHGVFTLPHEYNDLVPYNEELIYDLVFHAAADTLLREGERCLGGRLGLTALLHTWNQRLHRHVHVHFIIPAGALTEDGQWRPARSSKWLFDVSLLMNDYRTSLSRRLKTARTQGRLHFPPHLEHLKEKKAFDQFVDDTAEKDWEVYLKPPFAGPAKVLQYTANYTHRVAIGNSRIKDICGGEVTFTWRDRRNDNREETETIPAHEFLDRFRMHLLPHRYTKIRYFGFLAGNTRERCLAQARAALNCAPEEKPPCDPAELYCQATGIDLKRCPVCGGRMRPGPMPSGRHPWKWQRRATGPPDGRFHELAA